MFDVICSASDSAETNAILFAQIAAEIQTNGFSIHQHALPPALGASLVQHLDDMDAAKFAQAGVGRDQNFTHNESIRRDEICWITGESAAGKAWISWMQELQTFLNRRLFLGLFSFESHFAHYQPGDYYQRHVDAFKGEDNRILSVAIYLNREWQADDGGELVLYTNDHDQQGLAVTPNFGTLVVFLSEDFPHEVRIARRDRYSIAGWFRVNTSTAARVDPPS